MKISTLRLFLFGKTNRPMSECHNVQTNLGSGILVVVALVLICSPAAGQTSSSLQDRLQSVDSELLAKEARLRGNPERGGLVFHRSPAGCEKCHLSGEHGYTLGPDLASMGQDTTDVHIIDSLLDPSRSIRKGYETTRLLMLDGRVLTGLVASETDQELILRDAKNLEKETIIRKDEIDERKASTKSMMPDGLVGALGRQRDFLDLAAYIMEVAKGGNQAAIRLKPSPDQLIVKDDTTNLNHAGILKGLKQRDFVTGKQIYQGLCINCHGADGNTPSLPTARAFGKDKLKFGADPYQMFQTLSRGNGLMAPALHLSPLERYQVIHYIREEFMKESNPVYEKITGEYLKSLPKGTGNGKFELPGERDYGLALASQLDRDVTSALTVKLGSATVSYNLHTLNQTSIWKHGFLNLNGTQHIKGRGEGVPLPQGKMIDGLKGWHWGHDNTLDYPREDLLPRGPLPTKWLEYRGYYTHDDKLLLSYRIDGREILELPQELVLPGVNSSATIVRHSLKMGPGGELVLAAISLPDSDAQLEGIIPRGNDRPVAKDGLAESSIAIIGDLEGGQLGAFSAAAIVGDTEDLTLSVDAKHRIVLRIPPGEQSRILDVICFSGNGKSDLEELQKIVGTRTDHSTEFHQGSRLKWPKILTTVGYLGFEQGPYSLDTITIPDSTPWNTWFRTSALDFFPDGRMVVTTYGGDVWIVSGVDDKLLKLEWKRFAGGLYEPFGVKVVDGLIYVTCKDRLTRLHDLNDDGEADYYENFSADTDVSAWFHAFNFDLQTDSEGNFYYAKCGQSTSYQLPGAVIKISPDGKQREVYCTGFRAPNGMGIFPSDQLTVSDNQGNWMPASKISLVKPGGFYGYVQTHAKPGKFAPDGGRIDHTKVVPPETFDPPIIWMPQDYDNSSGGQIWVDDPRWGPLSGRMLHTSFGKGWMYYLMMQEVGDVSQAAIIKLPHDFVTGIMRGRVNPKDGQVYVTGLDGWNGNGRMGLLANGIQRVRYTGKALAMVTNCSVEHDGLRLQFNFPLDPTSASKVGAYDIEQWNYQWRHEYGSDRFHPETGAVGKEKVKISAATLGGDGKTVKLTIPKIRPVNQLRLKLKLDNREGKPFSEEIYWTINAVPDSE